MPESSASLKGVKYASYISNNHADHSLLVPGSWKSVDPITSISLATAAFVHFNAPYLRVIAHTISVIRKNEADYSLLECFVISSYFRKKKSAAGFGASDNQSKILTGTVESDTC